MAKGSWGGHWAHRTDVPYLRRLTAVAEQARIPSSPWALAGVRRKTGNKHWGMMGEERGVSVDRTQEDIRP